VFRRKWIFISLSGLGDASRALVIQVNQDLFDLGAVGLERETEIRLVEGEIHALEQLLQVVEKLVHTDGCVLRRGHTGQFAVVLREVEQAFAAAVDGL